MPWGKEHASKQSAEAEAARIRKIGMAARVEAVEAVEFGKSRRAFLIYAFACNLIPAERVVERIVADVESETST
jgi:hypothetical protein